MKIRSGFVSNSSSSSFILNFDGEPTIDDIKSFLSDFAPFDDLNYTAECFLKEMKKLTIEDVEEEISDYKNKSWASSELEDAKEKKKLIKKYPKGIYEIWISDHSSEDPWAICRVKKDKNGQKIDWESLENNMQWSNNPHILKWINGH